MKSTPLLFEIKNKYKKKRHYVPNSIQCNRLKKHERIGIMSHHHCISNLLDLKDKNITFPEDWMKEGKRVI